MMIPDSALMPCIVHATASFFDLTASIMSTILWRKCGGIDLKCLMCLVSYPQNLLHYLISLAFTRAPGAGKNIVTFAEALGPSLIFW